MKTVYLENQHKMKRDGRTFTEDYIHEKTERNKQKSTSWKTALSFRQWLKGAGTGPVAEAERLNGQVDVSGLGDVELILQRADTPISLQEETAPRTTVVPLLEKRTFLSLGPFKHSVCFLKLKCMYLSQRKRKQKMLYSCSSSGGQKCYTVFCWRVQFQQAMISKRLKSI